MQEQKPKKSRKRPRSISSSRPQKRKQKRRKTINSTNIMHSNIHDIISHCGEQETINTTIPHKMSDYYHHHTKMSSNIKYISSQLTTTTKLSSSPSLTTNHVPGITQDVLTMCENSSAYESSEDTGVGGLSESELMVGAHDVIGKLILIDLKLQKFLTNVFMYHFKTEEIPLSDTRLLEEHDLTNVLNQLPEDTFNELFTSGKFFFLF